MTTQSSAIFLQANSHPAEDVRQAFRSIIGMSGVIASTSVTSSSAIADLKVSQRGAGANMSVDIANGKCAILGSEGTYQGIYLCDNRGVQNVVVTAAHATSARLDRVVAKVQDAAYSGATNVWSLAVVAGTPSAVPALPAEPSNSFTLATISVAAAATSIVTANITDVRKYAAAAGGTQRVYAAPSSVITAPVSGQSAYLETDYTQYEYTTATSGWQKPWGQPWGVIAYGSTVTTQSAISAETDLTSLTASLPASWPANRRVRITVSLPNVAGTVANDSFALRIKEGATTLQQSIYSIASTVLYVNPSMEWIFTPSSGAHTYKAALVRNTGTGTSNNGAAATTAALFTIEDVGPAANPA